MTRTTNATKNARGLKVAEPKKVESIGPTRAKRADLAGVKLRQPKNRPIAYDVTRQNAIISIKSPRTGETATLKIVTQPTTPKFFPDKGDYIRVAYLFRGTDPNNVRHWRGFALVDEFGVHTFGTLKNNSDENVSLNVTPTIWERFSRMLEQPTFFREKGCEYTIHLID